MLCSPRPRRPRHTRTPLADAREHTRRGPLTPLRCRVPLLASARPGLKARARAATARVEAHQRTRGLRSAHVDHTAPHLDHDSAALRRPRFGLRCLLATIVSLAVLASALALAPIALGAGANGTIEGIVSAEAGPPKFAVEVVVFRESAGGYARLTQTATGAGGKYSVSVAPGNYKLEFVPSNKAFAYIYYDSQPTLVKAKPVTVLEGETVFAEQALPAGDTTSATSREKAPDSAARQSTCTRPTAGLAATTTSGGEGT